MFFFRLFTLRSAHVSALVIVLCDSPCERIGKWELSDCERGQIVGKRLAGASVTNTATLLGVSRATISKVMSAYTNHGTTTAKRNSGRKSALAGRDRRTLRKIVLKNHRTAAAQVTAELNIHLEDPVSTKTVRRELRKSNTHGRAVTSDY
jgi:transposase